MTKSMFTWSFLELRINITALLVKKRMDRTEAGNKNVTVRTVREKSIINVSCDVDGHRTEGVKNGYIFYMYIFRCRKKNVQLYSTRNRTRKDFIRCAT